MWLMTGWLSFNLTLEILLFDRPEFGKHSCPRGVVSISRLRFFCLIVLVERRAETDNQGFNLTLEILLFDRG